MKLSILTLLTIGLFSCSAFADTYHALMSGNSCNHCKRLVAKSLAELDGVKKVIFLKDKKNGLYQVQVFTESTSAISKQSALEVLKKAPRFSLKSWVRIDS